MVRCWTRCAEPPTGCSHPNVSIRRPGHLPPAARACRPFFRGYPVSAGLPVVSLIRSDGHPRCGGQAVRTVSYSAGLRQPRLLCSLRHVVPGFDPLEDRGAGVRPARPRFAAEQLPLQCGEKGLSEGVVPTLTGAVDRQQDAELGCEAGELAAGALGGINRSAQQGLQPIGRVSTSRVCRGRVFNCRAMVSRAVWVR